MEDLRKKLREEVGTAPWNELAPHAARGVLVVVGADLDVVEAGLALARDDKAVVQAWLADGRLARPSDEHLAAWAKRPATSFTFLIVQPYVLCQEAATTH